MRCFAANAIRHEMVHCILVINQYVLEVSKRWTPLMRTSFIEAAQSLSSANRRSRQDPHTSNISHFFLDNCCSCDNRICAMHSALVHITLKVDRLAAMFEDHHNRFQICIVPYYIDVVLKCVDFNAGMLATKSLQNWAIAHTKERRIKRISLLKYKLGWYPRGAPFEGESRLLCGRKQLRR